jgi:hypothetical protein
MRAERAPERGPSSFVTLIPLLISGRPGGRDDYVNYRASLFFGSENRRQPISRLLNA